MYFSYWGLTLSSFPVLMLFLSPLWSMRMSNVPLHRSLYVCFGCKPIEKTVGKCIVCLPRGFKFRQHHQINERFRKWQHLAVAFQQHCFCARMLSCSFPNMRLKLQKRGNFLVSSYFWTLFRTSIVWYSLPGKFL